MEIYLEILKFSLPAFWIFLAVALTFYFIRLRDRTKFEMDLAKRRYERQSSELRSSLSDSEYYTENAYQPKILSELMFHISRVEKVSQDTNRRIRKVSESFSSANNSLSFGIDENRLIEILNDIDFKEEKNVNGSLIRDISHSLNTPLSHIQSAVIRMNSIDPTPDNWRDFLSSVNSSVLICQSFISAYRELELVSSISESSADIEGVTEILRSAFNMYSERQEKILSFECPDQWPLKGYSRNYIASILLPLLENAVEASLNDERVSISAEVRGDKSVIVVTSKPQFLPVGDEIYSVGYTTKDGHEGTGLGAVKNLLGVHSGARLTHSIRGDHVDFEVLLPGGQ